MHVDHCISCRVSNPSSGKEQAELNPIKNVIVTFYIVHIDITEKLSGKNNQKEYIIVQKDAITKMVILMTSSANFVIFAVSSKKATVFCCECLSVSKSVCITVNTVYAHQTRTNWTVDSIVPLTLLPVCLYANCSVSLKAIDFKLCTHPSFLWTQYIGCNWDRLTISNSCRITDWSDMIISTSASAEVSKHFFLVFVKIYKLDPKDTI